MIIYFGGVLKSVYQFQLFNLQTGSCVEIVGMGNPSIAHCRGIEKQVRCETGHVTLAAISGTTTLVPYIVLICFATASLLQIGCL